MNKAQELEDQFNAKHETEPKPSVKSQMLRNMYTGLALFALWLIPMTIYAYYTAAHYLGVR